MSQSAFEVFNGLIEVWKLVLQVIMFLVLWKAVLGFEGKKREGIIFALFAAVNIVIGLWFNAMWARHIISIALVLGYCMFCRRKLFGKAVFVYLAFYNFHSLGYLTATGGYTKVMEGLMETLDVAQSGYMEQMNQRLACGLFLLLLFYTVAFGLMGIIFGKLIKRDSDMKWQDVVLLSVLNFVGSLLANIVIELLVVKIEGGVFTLFEEKPDLLWKMPMMAICIFAGEAALVYFWQKYRILLSERQKHFVEEQQVKAMKKRLEEVENFYGSIRKVRHEMKNHMTNIKGLAETKEYEEIEAYIRKMDETMQELEYHYMTGNAVTDVIINDKWNRAKKSGIRFETDFWYGGEIPAFDLGIVLNNLLDNAIEACEKQKSKDRFILLFLKKKKHFLLLEVENSFDGTICMLEGNMLPVTTKKNILPEILTEHGIGLENVREIAKRYLGGVNIKIEGNVFRVTVMLQQREQ